MQFGVVDDDVFFAVQLSVLLPIAQVSPVLAVPQTDVGLAQALFGQGLAGIDSHLDLYSRASPAPIFQSLHAVVVGHVGIHSAHRADPDPLGPGQKVHAQGSIKASLLSNLLARHQGRGAGFSQALSEQSLGLLGTGTQFLLAQCRRR